MQRNNNMLPVTGNEISAPLDYDEIILLIKFFLEIDNNGQLSLGLSLSLMSRYSHHSS